MKFDFDQVYERRGTKSFKWDGTKEYYGSDDCIAMWCADMDFACAQPIVDAIIKRAKNPIYGYTLRTKDFEDAVLGWLKNRHHCIVPRQWLAFAPPGVIYAIYVMLKIITKDGDSVMVHMPNYDPLFDLVVKSNRKLVKSPLVLNNGRFEIDFEKMEKLIKEKEVKALIISSPHNPTGRVWTIEELKKISRICLEHEVYMLVDEIHADFVAPKYEHIAFTRLGDEVAKHAMVCYSANKGFNLGGLQMCSLVIADEEKRALFNEQMLIAQTRLDTTFGLEATETAYTHPDCLNWLNEAIEYVEDNKDYVEEYLRKYIPKIKLLRSEGTYLLWFNCKKLGMHSQELEKFMVEKAKIAFCGGYEFGEEGKYFVRMTAAVPRKTIEKAMKQIEIAVNSL